MLDKASCLYLKKVAYRTIRIIELLETGKKDRAIIDTLYKEMPEIEVTRSLIGYYRRRLIKP